MIRSLNGVVLAVLAVVVIVLASMSMFVVDPTEQALVARFGQPIRDLIGVAVHRYGRLHRQAHTRARQRAAGSPGVRQSTPRGRRLRALSHRRSAALLSIRL